VVLDDGDFYVTSFDPNNHFEDNILRIEKFKPEKVWTAVLYDADNDGYAYVKRFLMDATKRHQNYLGENPESRLVLLTDQTYPRIRVSFSEGDAHREPMDIEVEEFISVKSFKAKRKCLTTWHIGEIEELEPTRKDDEILPDEEAPQDEDLETEDGSQEAEDVNQEAEDVSQETEDVTKGEDASPQFKCNPATGELSLFGNEEV
ncbi:MAG: DNA gyrase/topoisomerase IV subunit A, partial [Prevotella sp.]|nr:DNA gyrase/topoisomerase IV subunit A [Prevotella sp.]